MPGNFHLHNALIWTADRQRPRAGSLTVGEGEIIVLDETAGSGEAIDAGGCVVLPGMFDAHTHLLMGALSLDSLDLSEVCSRDEFEALIARRHAELEPGRWLLATGWSNENWPGGAPPDKSWLKAAGDRPVVCRRIDIHAALVNDAVLEMIDTSADPPGGTIVRDAGGAPTGLMVEAAAWELVNPLIPKTTVEQKRAALREAIAHHHALGVTSVMSMEDIQDVEQVFVPMRHDLNLRVQLTLLDRDWPMEFNFGRDFVGDAWLSVIGYKSFADGTLGSRTARMLEDYDDDDGNRGMLVELAAAGTLSPWAQGVAEAGLSPSIHAIGDEAARLVLDAVEDLPRNCVPRLEHVQQLSSNDIPRFRGRVASMQPLHRADDARYVTRRLGEGRLDGFFAFRELLDAGAMLAFGSDWPVVSIDPMLGIRAACSCRDLDDKIFAPEHAITIEEALRAYTVDAAAALGRRDVGMLREGCRGDFVMLDTTVDPAQWDPQSPGGRVLLTVVDGEVVYDAR